MCVYVYVWGGGGIDTNPILPGTDTCVTVYISLYTNPDFNLIRISHCKQPHDWHVLRVPRGSVSTDFPPISVFTSSRYVVSYQDHHSGAASGRIKWRPWKGLGIRIRPGCIHNRLRFDAFVAVASNYRTLFS